MDTLKDKGLAANVNDSMDAGGMAAADVTQASEQTKLREFLTKHRFKETEAGCHAVNIERVLQRRADPKSKHKEKPHQAWTGAGNGELSVPLVNKIGQLIEILCHNLHKYMKRPADGVKTEFEKSADPDTQTEALLVEFCKGVANEGMKTSKHARKNTSTHAHTHARHTPQTRAHTRTTHASDVHAHLPTHTRPRTHARIYTHTDTHTRTT